MRRSMRRFISPILKSHSPVLANNFELMGSLLLEGQAAMHPSSVDIKVARESLDEAMQLAEKCCATSNSLKSYEESHRKLLSNIYSEYAYFLHGTEPIQEVLDKIERLIHTALSLDPKNERALELQTDIELNWSKMPRP